MVGLDTARPRRGGSTVPQMPPSRAPGSRTTRWTLLGCVLALGLAALGRLEPLAATGLSADVGIQFHLASLALAGELPVRDFEHGWNVLGWWYLAFFYAISFGQASLWAFLWGTLAGPFLAGVLVLVIAKRQGLPALWLAGLTAATLLVSDVPNGKYALPALWLLMLRPGGRLDGPRSALVARALVAGVMVLAHLELAVMLCFGTAVYDLLGARGVTLRSRVSRVTALGAGGALAFAGELAAFAALGTAPAEVIRFLILERAAVSQAATAFDYSLLRPASLLGAVYPATLVLAFVPVLWRRLSGTTRLAACLHLALGLIAIRKPDEGHLGAATSLLVLLAVLTTWDVLHHPDRPPLPRPSARLVLPAVAGALWLVGTVVAGFSAGSVLALPLLVGLTVLGAVVARRSEVPAASAGAVVAAVALSAVSVASLSLAEVRGPTDELQERVMADALEPDVARCLGADRQAWVVPEPLGLYRFLDLENPTPYYLFWAGFRDETPEVLDRIDQGEIPAVVQVNGWPLSMVDMAPVIESTYDLCAEVVTPAVPEQGVPAQAVKIWVDR